MKWLTVISKAAIIMIAIFIFAIVWPCAAYNLLNSLSGHKLDADDMAAGFTWCAMFFVGIPVGTHVGMLAAQRTYWLASRMARQTFFFLSVVSALLITYIDFAMNCKFGGGTRYNAAYFLSVQGLPILWFLYNANGRIIRVMWTLRRKRTS